MAVRSRRSSEDFNNSNYDRQYTDDEASDSVHLDHRRLYITRISPGLNEVGLRAAFSKFGALNECFVNNDPNKRYGLVSFETAGEASLAMMKMNKTEPLKLNISIAHKTGAGKKKNNNDRRDKEFNNRDSDRHQRDKNNSYNKKEHHKERKDHHRDCMVEKNNGWEKEKYRERDDSSSGWGEGSRGHRQDSGSVTGKRNRRQVDMANGDNNVSIDNLPVERDSEMNLESLDSDLQLQLEQLEMEQLKVRQKELELKKKILMKQAKGRDVPQSSVQTTRTMLPDGRMVVRNITVERQERSEHHDGDTSFAAGGGDSNEREACSCKTKTWVCPSSSEDGSSTPSTCVLCSDTHNRRSKPCQDKSDLSSKYSKRIDCRQDSRKSSKTTDLTSKNSQYSRCTETVSKRSEVTSKRLLVHRKVEKKSDVTCDVNNDVYSDSEGDETNRLIQLRNSDYMDIVDDNLKLVLAVADYPKSKMRLRQMEQFQRSLSDIMDMQIKAGLLRKTPSFFDYYLNRGAIVCICKDSDTKDWMVRVSPGIQERMSKNLILLKAKVKRLCLAVLKIPKSCWPATAQDTFQLLQYFNPTLKTETWRIYGQQVRDNVECTSFLVDRISGEIIRGPTFKNIIDYNQMEFELTGYTEIYYQGLLSDEEEDMSSIASRVKLLEEIKSNNSTPRYTSECNVKKHPNPVRETKKNDKGEDTQKMDDFENITAHPEESIDYKQQLEAILEREVLQKMKDVKYISEDDDVIAWGDETKFSGQENEKADENKDDGRQNYASVSVGAGSDKTESINESTENLTLNRNSNLNIDSSRGIAYHRRTNYLHVEPELKIAITLEDYPQNKLEGTHIRRLKHLFKEYLHKDMKNQRFTNLIMPKFQDIYLSNGAVIYICDSLETKDYLTEVLPKFINSTGLKLTFRDIKDLVRYTRVVMRLAKEHANVESLEILLKLKEKYPGLKPECWKYYSDVAGKQKRQFGVDPKSLEVIKSPRFAPDYEGDSISFRIIDRKKRDVSFEESTIPDLEVEIGKNEDHKKLREKVLKIIYVPIDPEITNSPLTRIRINHYSDLIADDLKLYVGPANYPETRIEDHLFYSIKRTFENIVCESLQEGDMTEYNAPKFHDIYLFDGVIFIICQNMASRRWVEQITSTVNAKLHIQLKSTEFRGAVGIVSMFLKTDKDTEEVIRILQQQNPRLRTKYWRKISTISTKTKLDVVLQIDKLSAHVITSESFNKFIGDNAVQFKLGHLKSLLKPKLSLEQLTKKVNMTSSGIKVTESKSKSKVSMQGPKDKTFEEVKRDIKKEYPSLKVNDWHITAHHEKANHKVSDLEIDSDSAKIIEKEDFKLSTGADKLFFYTLSSLASDKSIQLEVESPKSFNNSNMVPVGNDTRDFRKMILKIPLNILPENKDDLNVIFDLLEDKNPGLNTELWQVFTDLPYPNNGKFTIFIDEQSASIIQGGKFDSNIGGKKLTFFF